MSNNNPGIDTLEARAIPETFERKLTATEWLQCFTIAVFEVNLLIS